MIHWGVIHSTRRPKEVLQGTVGSLCDCGVERLVVFPDRGDYGATANLCRAIRDLASKASAGDHVCVVDDDLRFAPGMLRMMNEVVGAYPGGAYSLWTVEQNIPHERRDQSGWVGVKPHIHLWGGSVVMPAQLATTVANRMFTMAMQDERLLTKPDAALFAALEKTGTREVFFHIPSLATHAELEASTLGNVHVDGATLGYRFNEWAS